MYIIFTLATSRAIIFSHQTSIIAGFSQQNACTNLGLHPGYPLRNLQAGFYEINGSPNNQKIMGFRPLRVLWMITGPA